MTGRPPALHPLSMMPPPSLPYPQQDETAFALGFIHPLVRDTNNSPHASVAIAKRAVFFTRAYFVNPANPCAHAWFAPSRLWGTLDAVRHLWMATGCFCYDHAPLPPPNSLLYPPCPARPRDTQALKDDLPSAFLLNTVVGAHSSGEVILQNYNTLFTLSKLAKCSDGILVRLFFVLPSSTTTLTHPSTT